MLYNLQEPIEWNPEQKDICEEFNQMKNTVHNPIGQPFCVIIFFFGLYCFDSLIKKVKSRIWLQKNYIYKNTNLRCIGWIQEAKKIAEKISTIAHHQIYGKENNNTCNHQVNELIKVVHLLLNK